VRLLILAALLGATVWLILRGFRRPVPGPGGRRVEGDATPLVACAVCGTYVPETAAVTGRVGGAERRCCGEACAAKLREGEGR